MRVTRDTLVDDSEDGPLILGILDLSLPCRRFVVEHKVAEAGKISVPAAFLLRFVKALASCSEEDAQTFFAYSRREKTGSASCSASVCPHASISVLAAPLTNHHPPPPPPP